MPFFPSLPADAGIGQLWSMNPSLRKPTNDLGTVIMRGESPLSAAQRETIAAYVSAVNQCQYCLKGHAQMAVNLGVDRATLESMIDDLEHSAVDEPFKAILRFVKKLTLTPYAMQQEDADAVFAAGWTERALHDAILVCCRFNFMNRLSLAHGLDPDGVTPEQRAANMSYDKT